MKPHPIQPDHLKTALRLAADWLTDVAQIQTDHLLDEDPWHFRYDSWKGAIRGEYRVARKKWGFFCPVWHTGQAVKALLMAARLLRDERYRAAARLGADFILGQQVWQKGHPDHGLILAFEDSPSYVNTSAVLEAMDGLLILAEEERAEEIRPRLIRAGEFLIEKLFLPQEGLFRDAYDPVHHAVVLPNPFPTRNDIGGRPLLDDAIWAKLYRLTGDGRFLDVQVRVSETLVAHQRPKGNWVEYAPCNSRTMVFHPRHTYWWGLPLMETWRETQRKEFRETAVAAGEFTRRAMRRDGGCFRGTCLHETTGEIQTDSFGHATSGSACGAILFLELFAATGASSWREAAETALAFCLSMQMTHPQDPNLKGVILEKVFPPDGSDGSPYHIRDLGTIFFIQAAAQYLQKHAAQTD
ncbi:MAG: hypothetical protein HY360_21090 [Verrucomicrobia bacterium]|nr:hypothetical protein [Verrucomicrobiota bacterium]